MRYCAELYMCFSDNIFVYCLGKEAQEWDKTIINDTDSSELVFNTCIPCKRFCGVLSFPSTDVSTPLDSILDYIMCCTCLIPCITLPCLRRRVRKKIEKIEKHGKGGNCCNDIVQSLCCYPCTLSTLKASIDILEKRRAEGMSAPFMVNSILDTTISIKDLRSP